MTQSGACWQVLSDTEVYSKKPRLRVSLQRIALPDGREVADYLRLAVPDYVTMLAVTEAGLVLAERQYKHGPGRPTLTLPAGMIESGEAPEAAAKRELLEETGHVAEAWQKVGVFVTLGNMAGPSQHLFIARGCRAICAPDSGDLEDMEIVTLPPAALVAAVLAGEVAIAGDALGILAGFVKLGWLNIGAAL